MGKITGTTELNGPVYVNGIGGYDGTNPSGAFSLRQSLKEFFKLSDIAQWNDEYGTILLTTEGDFDEWLVCDLNKVIYDDFNFEYLYYLITNIDTSRKIFNTYVTGFLAELDSSEYAVQDIINYHIWCSQLMNDCVGDTIDGIEALAFVKYKAMNYNIYWACCCIER